MLKAREILRLKHDMGLSLREIGKACNCGKTTVSEVLGRAVEANVTWPVELSDKQLMSLLYPPVENQDSPLKPDIEYIYSEMKKKGVTLMCTIEDLYAVFQSLNLVHVTRVILVGDPSQLPPIGTGRPFPTVQ